ncbi:chemotaxis protein [Escherichia coli]|nr:chemotaxis protein [Escherichia coli]
MGSSFSAVCTFAARPLKPFLIVTNGAIVIHTQRLKSDPGGNLLS